MSGTPLHPPADFDLESAHFCAGLTDDAYAMYTQWTEQDKPRREQEFNWRPPDLDLQFSTPIWSTKKVFGFFDESEPFGFVARRDDGTGYLVFRGTESIADWIADATIGHARYDLVPGYGDVHEGFLELYLSMRDDLFRAFNEVDAVNDLWVTGHSLGCGLSTLAVPDVMNVRGYAHVRHYNFASPRVGAPSFADAYNDNGVPTFRVVNTCDVVPTVPPSVLGRLLFQHVGVPVDFTTQNGSIVENHSLDDAYLPAL